MPRTSLNYTQFSYANHHWLEKTIDTNTVLMDHSESLAAHGISEIRSTVNTPGFKKTKKRVDKRDLPLNPFSYQKRSSLSPYGVEHYWYPDLNRHGSKVGVLQYGTNMEPRLITQEVRDEIDAKAILALHKAAGESSTNLLVVLRERKESERLLLGAVDRIIATYKALRWGNIRAAVDELLQPIGADADFKRKSARQATQNYGYHKWLHSDEGKKMLRREGLARLSKNLANDVLSLKFGWEPILQDLQGVFESAAKAADRAWKTRIATTRTYRKFENSYETWEGVDVRRNETAVYARKYVVYVSAAEGVSKTLQEFGIWNPLHSAYAAFPFTFMLDWVYNLGRYLDYLDSFAALKFEKGSNTSFERTIVRYKCDGSCEAYGGYRRIKATASKVHVDNTRTVITGVPSLPMPSIQLDFAEAGRGLITLALLRQKLDPSRRWLKGLA